MKIIVAIDSSSFADAILDEIVHRAFPEGSQIKLLTVCGSSGHWENDQQFLHQTECILLERVAFLKKRLPTSITCSGEAMEGQAARTINKLAREWKADLVVIGAHGESGVRRLGIGSVAADVVTDAPCTVEVIKAHRHKANSEKLPAGSQAKCV